MTRDELKENFMVAANTLRARKGRSALTILGIVIGVTSVISVAAIIGGLNQHVAERVQKLGARSFFVSRLPFVQFGRLPEKIRQRKYINYDDARVVREGCRNCKYVTSFITRAIFMGDATQMRVGGEQVDNPIVRGVEPEYADAVPAFGISDGRFVSAFDEDHSRYVCVIGAGIAGSLFPTSDPVGREVKLNGLPFEVIGVFEKDPGLFGGPGVDQFVAIPYSAFHKLWPQIKENFLAISVNDPTQMPAAMDEVTQIVRRVRKVPVKEENDFEIATPDFLTDLWNKLTGAIVILTAVISSIGLLVGGIGVMNIMLISVTERTAEIGVRKAVGARRQDIRVQFLIEAMTLTCFGGLLGVLAGAAISALVHLLVPSLPAQLSLFWVVMGFTISAAVGLFFGFYPANRAAGLDPIVCLRYE